MADIVPYLERLRARFDEPSMQNAFRGFHKTMLFSFPDLQRDYLLTVNEDGSASVAEQSLAQPDIKVTMTSDLLANILDRRTNPVNAYITRKMKVSGNMEDLLRLQKIL
jgi:putative sterol carrier protein